MKGIIKKNGSALSVFVTMFVMIALLSAGLILLLKYEIIFINPQYVDGFQPQYNDNNGNSDVEKNNFEQYEGIVNGSSVKQLLEYVSKEGLSNIVVYISENSVNREEAQKENATIILMANARIANSTAFTEIIDNNSYNVIIEKNSDNVVEKIYVVKINNDI